MTDTVVVLVIIAGLSVLAFSSMRRHNQRFTECKISCAPHGVYLLTEEDCMCNTAETVGRCR